GGGGGERVAPRGAVFNALSGGGAPLLAPTSLRDLPPSPELRYWLIHEIEALLERAAHDQALAVVIDDLQWADTSSVAALEALTQRLRSLPIAWIVAVRSTEVSP